MSILFQILPWVSASLENLFNSTYYLGQYVAMLKKDGLIGSDPL